MSRAVSTRRRVAAALGGLIAALIPVGAIVLDRPDGPRRIQVQVSDQAIGRPLPDGYLGLSIEFGAVHRYLGRDPQALNPIFLRLVGALDPGGHPVLRIGGDSTDHAWVPLPGLVEPVGVSYPITRDWMQTVHHAAAALRARLIVGVDLAADNPQVAAVEARTLVRYLGRRYVSALEIGNEPDVYTAFAWYRSRRGTVGFARGTSWTSSRYRQAFTEWAAAAPRIALAGPADAYPGWMQGLGGLLATQPRLRIVTFHRYPLRACGPADRGALAATVPNLLDQASTGGLARQVTRFVAIAHAAGRPFRLDELNSASCGGAAGVSDTFASALWVLDTLFGMAAQGVDGVNLHTLPGAAYAPFAFVDRHGSWRARVEPLYYGLLMFRRAFPTGARRLRVAVRGSGLEVWATRSRGGVVHTVLINPDPHRRAVVRLVMAGGRPALSAVTLTAPGLAARSGVALGGRGFGPTTTTGRLPAPRATRIEPRHGRYILTVAPASAVLLTG